MSVFDKKARMRRLGADDNASNILSADTNPSFPADDLLAI